MNAPPGNAGVQEYVEIVPDGRGGRRSIDLHNGSITALRSRGSLSQTTRDRLSGAGGDGEAAAALAEAGSAGKAKRSSDSGDGSSAAGLLGTADGLGGMGLVLPLLLVLLLAAALAYELKRRRATS